MKYLKLFEKKDGFTEEDIQIIKDLSYDVSDLSDDFNIRIDSEGNPEIHFMLITYSFDVKFMEIIIGSDTNIIKQSKERSLLFGELLSASYDLLERIQSLGYNIMYITSWDDYDNSRQSNKRAFTIRINNKNN